MRDKTTGEHPDGSPIESLDLERAIDEGEAAGILGLSRITLTQMRYRGEGPRFFRPGRRGIRFRLGDVLAYRDARTVGARP